MASSLVPLLGVCLSRETTIEHVRALVEAEALPPPATSREGTEMVPATYLDEIDPDPLPPIPSGEWDDHVRRELRRFRDGRKRLLTAVARDAARRREQQLTRIASAAWGIGLAQLMEGQRDASRVWLSRAATLYRRSLADAEAGSWGRSIGGIKSRLLADDSWGAVQEARSTLQLGALHGSTIGRYAGCLALLVLSRDKQARSVAQKLETTDGFPQATAGTLAALAEGDRQRYGTEIRNVLTTFETRTRFLEDIPVADTVLVLQSLATTRGITLDLASPRLPSSG